jgi:hypothetical protein
MNPHYQKLYRMLQAGMRGNDCDTVICYKHQAADELRKAGYRVSRDTSWVKLSQALRNFAPGCDAPDPRRPQPVICEADRRILECMYGKAKDTSMAEMIHLHGVTFRRLRDLGYREIHARSTPQTIASTLESYLLGSVEGETQSDRVLTFRSYILTTLAKDAEAGRKARKEAEPDERAEGHRKEAKRMLARIGVTEAETAMPRRLRNLFYHHFPSFMWSTDCPPDMIDDDMIWPWTLRKGKDSWKV